jgi:alkylated DNA repair protein (DNA oxidative demethylase)
LQRVVSKMPQMDLWDRDEEAPALPEGLSYRPDLLTGAEEEELIARIAALPFAPFQFHGFEGKRRTVSFGWQYKFDGSGLAEAEPMPDWLLIVRDKAARFGGMAAGDLVHALVIEYAQGAGIGWHRDRPDFGEVIGISLKSEAPLRFRLKEGSRWRRLTLSAAPRSAYHLAGPAREQWEHSILAVPALRYSITFRTLRKPPPSRSDS